MRKTLDFYFDFVSPASYLAWTQLPAICEPFDVELNPLPILLGGLMKATGNSPPMTVPAKGRYLMMDLQRHARQYGVTFRSNPAFPFNTLPLLRMAAGLKACDAGRLNPFLDLAFHAIWADGKDLGKPDIIRQTLQAAGFNPEQLFGLADDPQIKAVVVGNTQQAEQRGAFGAPTMYFKDQMFFGQDRLELLRRALETEMLPHQRTGGRPSSSTRPD